MLKMSVREAKARFSEMLRRAQDESVTITRHGHPVALVIGVDEIPLEELAGVKTVEQIVELWSRYLGPPASEGDGSLL